MKSILESIMDSYPEEMFLKWDNLDSAVIGVEESSMRLIYSKQLIYEELMLQGMEYEEAIEFYDFNIGCAYVGEKTPIHCDSMGSVIICHGEED